MNVAPDVVLAVLISSANDYTVEVAAITGKVVLQYRRCNAVAGSKIDIERSVSGDILRLLRKRRSRKSSGNWIAPDSGAADCDSVATRITLYGNVIYRTLRIYPYRAKQPNKR
jgi:hypothetical protein